MGSEVAKDKKNWIPRWHVRKGLFIIIYDLNLQKLVREHCLACKNE